MKPSPISTPSVAPARQAAAGAPKTRRGKSAAKRSAASGIRTARYESGGQWSSTPRATAKVEPQMSVVKSIAPSAARLVFSLMRAGQLPSGAGGGVAWIRRFEISDAQQDFEDARLGGALHGADALGERELRVDERVDLARVAAQQLERRGEAPAPRADDADLVHDDRRGVQLGLPVESRLEDERAARAQQPERRL